MFCTTFYSYKGGVGRTLALANVAAGLALRGKKVLLVDMDLEAPGLTTLHFCEGARRKPGVVEFVNEYILNGEAPSASKYVHECVLENPNGPNVNIHVMPAGDLDAAYGSNYARIDWRDLYENKNGFLLMEDLRTQWSNNGFDYVFIDSRTGVTDISGICTRQLPDLTLAVFFPNEQNLLGLKEVVSDVRSSPGRSEPPQLLFVASRVPRLDDEYGILRSWLDRFKSDLNYSDMQAAKVEQYDSLALLDQQIFVLSRPKTELAHQYRNLTKLISQVNTEDADGALSYVNTVRAMYDGSIDHDTVIDDSSNPFAILSIEPRLDKISQTHSNDCMIQAALAEHFFSSRDFGKLEAAIDNGLSSFGQTGTLESVEAGVRPRLYQLRLRRSAEIQDIETAESSASAILLESTATEQMVVDALLFLMNLGSERLPAPHLIAYLEAADWESSSRLIAKLSQSRQGSSYLGLLASHLVSKLDKQQDGSEVESVLLAFINAKRFDDAVSLLDSVKLSGFQLVSGHFNRAMAVWGRDGSPDFADLKNVSELMLNHILSYGSYANYNQCLALVFAALKDVDKALVYTNAARDCLRTSGAKKEFSCWSYREETVGIFLKHCASIVDLSKGLVGKPQFIEN